MGVVVIEERVTSVERDPCLYDIELLDQRFEVECDRVFVAEDDMYLQVIENGEKPRYFESALDLGGYFEESEDLQGLRVVNIQQQSSVGPLAISHAAARVLIAKASIFAPFLQLINAFGTKDTYAPRSLPPPFEWESEGRTRTECCYMLKHVEKHDRSNATDEWSIRQTGVYIQTDSTARRQTVVLLKPIRRAQRRYIDTSKEKNLDATDMETLILSTSMFNWHEYMDSLEREVNNKVTSAFATFGDMPLTPQSSEHYRHNIEAGPFDVHRLVYLGQKLEAVHCALHFNLEVLNKRQDTLNRGTHQRGDVLMTTLSNLILRSTSLHDRMRLALDLVRGTLDMRTSQRSMEIAGLARKDSIATLGLSRRTVDDSRVLKIIAVLTLFYLPASFAASFLNNDYVSFVQGKPLTLSVDKNVIVFVILTVILLVLTVMVWFAYEFYQRRMSPLRDEEIGTI